MAGGGSYDDHWESIVATSFDRTLLETKKDELEAQKIVDDQRRQAVNIFAQEWRDANPRPAAPTLFRPKKVPDWKGIKPKNITPAMKEEKKAIMEWNMQEASKVAKPHNDWAQDHLNAQKEWAAAQGWDYMEVIFGINDYSTAEYWNIEEADFLE